MRRRIDKAPGVVAAVTATALLGLPVLGAPPAGAARGGAPVAGVVPTALAHAHLPRGYALELLEPTSNGVAAAALGINDAGDVVGIARPTTGARPQATVLWERHGDHFHAHELANLSDSTFSRGFDLNASAVIVGEAFDAGGTSVPVTWTGDSAPEHITGLNQAGTGILRDINDDGTAVGNASGVGVLLRPDGTVAALPRPAPGEAGATVASYSAATISPAGVVGGRASVVVPHGDHTHTHLAGVVWDGEEQRLLDPPEGGSSPDVTGVTDDGDAVGSATVGTTEIAVTWDETGAVSQLPTPGIAEFPHVAAKATEGGIVVGNASKFAGNTSFGGAAVAWDSHGVADLNTLVEELPEGVTLQAASDINAVGQIVGTALTAGGLRGFVLTPVEEGPAATTLAIAGLAEHYRSGDEVALGAVQEPQTELDHYHWFTRPAGTQEWTAVASLTAGRYTFTAAPEHDGTEVIARLYDDQHAVVAESAPVTIRVEAHADPTTDPTAPPKTDLPAGATPSAVAVTDLAIARTVKAAGRRGAVTFTVRAAGEPVIGTFLVQVGKRTQAVRSVDGTLSFVLGKKAARRTAGQRVKAQIVYAGSAELLPFATSTVIKVGKRR